MHLRMAPRMRCWPAMAESFNAEDFVRKLHDGGFDGQVTEAIDQLSREELDEVASLLATRLRTENALSPVDAGGRRVKLTRYTRAR